MADRYWVGVNASWHDLNNWATSSGGAGGAGIPTASDDVFFDGNGNTLCWPSADIVCNNLSLLAAMTEMLLIDASAVINGDFSMAAGYFGPTGGPDHVIEFKGNWLNTGGTFAVGTGTGTDPECIFSGIDKTYTLNNLSAATYQNVTISGTYTFTGTRLSIMNISQKLSITGTVTLNAQSLTSITTITLDGLNAGFAVFTGTLTGTGRFIYRLRSAHTMVDTGTITIRYFRYAVTTTTNPGTVSVVAREYTSPCRVEFEYTADGQTIELGAGKHLFGYTLTLYGDISAIITACFDCATNMAEMWIEGKFDIYKNAFPNAVFTLKLGDGTHVFRGTVDFYFSYSAGSSAQLVVDPGDGTIILWPKGRTAIPVSRGI